MSDLMAIDDDLREEARAALFMVGVLLNHRTNGDDESVREFAADLLERVAKYYPGMRKVAA